MKTIAIGVDVGGSHVSCMAYDLEKKNLLTDSISERDLNNHAQPAEIIAAWGGVIKETIDIVGSDRVNGVGFAMPGPFDYVNGISLFQGLNGKYENTYGLNVSNELRKMLNLSNGFKIRLINDAAAFAIGEDQVGKAKSYHRSLSITLGTGLGSAFIKDGLPVVEGAEVPENGCMWHLPFENGIADDYFSTRGLLSRFEKISGKKLQDVKQIADLAKTNRYVHELFDDFGVKMGVFLQPWIEKFGIEVLVMGGNISRAYHLYGDGLRGYLETTNLKMDIAVSELKETAAFIGSATLVDDAFYNSVLPALHKM
ncbi:ROK family protein [Geofilum sp. OHC36d9]|uniref:ROK family protein n=1 Tax=Geofilum sp. OHC36d9 TaxID=3458413 RepID=UPI0040332076